MLKPPAPTIPGMTDTLDFVKNLWGSMNLPGAGLPGMSGLTTPTLSTDDLDKRIADLKAVESWLNLNLTMLRGTIQALEVQRGTLATLKSMGASMAEAMRQSGVSTEKMATMPFAPFFSAATPPAAAGAKAPSPSPSAPSPTPGPAGGPPAASASNTGGGSGTQPGTSGAHAGPASAQASGAQPSDPSGMAGAAAALGMPAAMAWWNMLQDQFTQAVTSAMAPAAAAAASMAAPDGAGEAKPAPKPDLSRAAPPDGAANGSAAAKDGGVDVGNGRRAGRTKAGKA